MMAPTSAGMMAQGWKLQAILPLDNPSGTNCRISLRQRVSAREKAMKRTAIAVFLTLGLGGCVVTTVADTAATVVGTAVETTADVVGGAVDLVVD